MILKFLFITIKLVISVALISYIVANLDLSQVSSMLINLRWENLLLGAVCIILLIINNAMRWNIILAVIDRPYLIGLLFRIQYMAGFFNQALPSMLGGDALRVYFLHKTGGALKPAINSILLERVISLACLIFLVTFLQFFVELRPQKVVVYYVFPILSVSAVIGILVLTQINRLPKSFSRWIIIRGLVNLATDAKKVFFSFSCAVKIIFFGLTSNILLCAITYFCANSLGIELTLMQALVLVPPAILVSTLPISIAGWGVREGAMVTTLSMAGIVEADAFILSILFGLLMVIISLPGGVIWLLHNNNKSFI